jgi:hypothetical protein
MECSKRRRQQASAFKQAVLAEVKNLRAQLEAKEKNIQEEVNNFVIILFSLLFLVT